MVITELLHADLDLAAELLHAELNLAAEFLHADLDLTAEFLRAGMNLAAEFVHPGFLLGAKIANVLFQALKARVAFHIGWSLFHHLHEHSETYRLQRTPLVRLDGVIDPVGEWVEPGGDHEDL